MSNFASTAEMTANSLLLIAAKTTLFKILPIKVRTAIAYQLAKVHASGTIRCEVYPGVLLDLDMGDWIQRLYYLGELDKFRLALLKSMTPTGGIFVDVGANVGLYTCTMARHVGPDGRVVAFEPMPENLRCLDRNIELNGLTNVCVYPVALSNHVGTVKLFVPPSHPGGPSAATEIRNPGDWKAVGIADVTTLDTVFDDERLDLMKIDVQGHEVAILEGAQNVIQRFRPIIVCEVFAHNHAAVRELTNAWRYKRLVQTARGCLTSCVPEFDGWTDLFFIPDEKWIANTLDSH